MVMRVRKKLFLLLALFIAPKVEMVEKSIDNLDTKEHETAIGRITSLALAKSLCFFIVRDTDSGKVPEIVKNANFESLPNYEIPANSSRFVSRDGKRFLFEVKYVQENERRIFLANSLDDISLTLPIITELEGVKLDLSKIVWLVDESFKNVFYACKAQDSDKAFIEIVNLGDYNQANIQTRNIAIELGHPFSSREQLLESLKYYSKV